MEPVTLPTALAAGFLSAGTVCLLPILLTHWAFMAGLALDTSITPPGKADTGTPWRALVLGAGAAFGAGFALACAALGTSASTIGDLLLGRLHILGGIGGGVIVWIGLRRAEILPSGWWIGRVGASSRKGPVSAAFLIGLVLPFGWTPCDDPALDYLLTLGATRGTVGLAAVLLASYAVGTATALMISALAVVECARALTIVRAHATTLCRVAAVCLIVSGVLVATGRLHVVP